MHYLLLNGFREPDKVLDKLVFRQTNFAPSDNPDPQFDVEHWMPLQAVTAALESLEKHTEVSFNQLVSGAYLSDRKFIKCHI